MIKYRCELEKESCLNGRYRICQCIGQGGFGITYLAKDESLRQNVVIKEYFPVTLVSREEGGALKPCGEMSAGKKFAEGMKRFLKEAQILASLFEVPGVVKVLDYFQENGTAYIVMEHVKGISLRTYLERSEEEISFDRALSMLLPVVSALEKIHKKGLLHRDINPDNLMVEESGSVKLLDFGAAREYLQEQDSEKTKTVLLKSGYAPPEQYDGKGHQGPWTDIYALCAIMYEMMTGCMMPGALERQAKDELYAPSCYGIAITPEQEERFLKKGLALDYRQRYRTLQEFRADFFPEYREERKKKNHIWWGLAALIVAAAAGGFFLNLWENTDSRGQTLAGNYDRDSQEYREFLDFVKENAVETSYHQDEAVYMLDEKSVEALAVPANGYYRMKYGPQEVMEILEDAGYSPIFKESEQYFTVTEEPHGVLKSEFTVQDSYRLSGGIGLSLCYDHNSGQLTDIYIFQYQREESDGAASLTEDTSDGTASLVADLIAGLVPDLTEKLRKDAADLREGIAEYNEQAKSGALVYYAWPLEDLEVRLFQISDAEDSEDRLFQISEVEDSEERLFQISTDSEEKLSEVLEHEVSGDKHPGASEPESRTGIHICLRAENAPPYNW